MIDTLKKHAMAILDVPGAYLNVDMPEKNVFQKLNDDFVDIMFEFSPEIIKGVQQKVKKKVPYLRVLKAFYGFIESTLLWYSTYQDTLEK